MSFPACVRFAATHCLALLLGLGGYALVSKHGGSSVNETGEVAVSRGVAGSKHRSAARLSSNESFRKTYQALASHPMSAGERRELKRNLLKEWGERDPQGLLAFLDRTRIWPDGFYLSDLAESASDRPDVLLDFAIRNGCADALYPLVYGDPQTVVRLIEALPPADRGDEIMNLAAKLYQKMGKAGIVARPTPAYLFGVAEALAEEGRLQEFCDTFERIDDDGLRGDAARKLGNALSEGKLDDEALGVLARLPAEYQEIVVSEMYHSSAEPMKFPEAREERREAITLLADNGLATGAVSAVWALFNDDDHENVNRETLEWLKNFPLNDSWKSIEKAVLSKWARFDLAAMTDGISSIPDDAVRGRLAEGAVKGVRIGGVSEDAKPDLARLMALISDPEVLKQFEEEDRNPRDPFADPFAD